MLWFDQTSNATSTPCPQGPINGADEDAAWLLWHLAYLQRNPSWNKRIRLVVDWLLSGLLGRETEQLHLTPGLPQHMSVLARKPDQPV